MIILRNKSRTARTYNLPHEQYCASNKCFCSSTEHPRYVHGEIGQSGTQILTRRVCSSTTILALGESAQLADSVLNCPDVRADLDRGVLVVVQHKTVEPPIEAPAPKRTRPKQEQG